MLVHEGRWSCGLLSYNNLQLDLPPCPSRGVVAGLLDLRATGALQVGWVHAKNKIIFTSTTSYTLNTMINRRYAITIV